MPLYRPARFQPAYIEVREDQFINLPPKSSGTGELTQKTRAS
jgi:hypothetical protein